MKIGVIGDPHFRENLTYSEYLPDGRKAELQAVLDATVGFFADCETVVLLGDNFDVKNPPAKVTRAFTEFLERFSGKNLYIIAGNHEKSANGSSAIDYLKEIKNPKWHVITDTIQATDDLVFCPYFFRQELGVETYAEAIGKLMLMLEYKKPRKYLFVHHAISDTLTFSGENTNLFNEIVFPKTELEKRFNMIIGGHIHRPGLYGKTLVAGSLLSQEAGDKNNAVWKIDTETDEVEKCILPVRNIYRLENPTLDVIGKVLGQGAEFKHSILKVVLTDKAMKDKAEEIKAAGKEFDAFILQEQYPREREKKSKSEDNLLDANIETLIKHYAKQKKVDYAPLLAAWEKLK